MALKCRVAILFFLARIVFSAGHIVDSEEKILGIDFENEYVISEKTAGGISNFYVTPFSDYDKSDDTRFAESEESFENEYDYEKNEDNEIEDEETPYLKIIPPRALPSLSRVRRRIIPRVTGKTTMDTDRGNRNPWDRDRSPYRDGQGGAGVIRRTGPMGSEKLYALYPHLAPSGWKKGKNSKPQRKSQRKKQEEQQEDVEVMDEGYSDTKSEEREVPSSAKRKFRPKSKMPKEIKEEIASYALQHGNEAAQEHFQRKLGVRIRPATVEKFVRRLQERIERRKHRESKYEWK